LGRHCWQVVIHYGFMNDPNVPKALQSLVQQGCQLDPMSTSYFLSRDTVIPTIGGGMALGAKSCLPKCTTTPAARPTF
jgi:KUP system potassium uptake protein